MDRAIPDPLCFSPHIPAQSVSAGRGSKMGLMEAGVSTQMTNSVAATLDVRFDVRRIDVL
jgi:hypothetical protein